MTTKTILLALATLACAPAHAASLADFNPIDLTCESVDGAGGHPAGWGHAKVHIDTVGNAITITSRHKEPGSLLGDHIDVAQHFPVGQAGTNAEGPQRVREPQV